MAHAQKKALQPWQTLPSRAATVWTIGEADPSGGAGVLADIQAINGLQADSTCPAHACAIITASMAQNSQSVSDVLAQPIDLLQQQWDQLIADLPPAVIKVSLLANPEQVEWLAQQIAHWPEGLARPVVLYDPVALAHDETQWLAEPIMDVVKQHWLPHVDLLTPNAAEVLALTGIALLSSDDLARAFARLQADGVGAVLFTGGSTGALMDIEASEHHVLDVFMNGESTRICMSPLATTRAVSGCGAGLSSALASLLAQGYAVEDSMAIAHAYVQQGRKQSVAYGQGDAPLRHLGWPTRWLDMPQTFNGFDELAVGPFAFPPCPEQLGLYPVVDSIAWLQQLLEAGVKTIQLRVKSLTHAQAEPLIQQAVELGHQFHARVFINDYWQLAVKHRAYGVHLGQEDVDEADLAHIADAGVRLGLSTHGYFEMLRAARLNPSYVALGHIYPTTTKQMPSTPQGLIKLRQQAALLKHRLPSVAIGGIDWQRAEPVKRTGVGSLAIVRAITQAEDVSQTVHDWLALVGAGDEDVNHEG